MVMFISDMDALQINASAGNFSNATHERCFAGDLGVSDLSVAPPFSNFISLGMLVAAILWFCGNLYAVREKEKPMALLHRWQNVSKSPIACGLSKFDILKMVDDTLVSSVALNLILLQQTVVWQREAYYGLQMNNSTQLLAMVIFLWALGLICSSCCCRKMLQKYVVKCTLGLFGIAAFVGAIHSLTTATAAAATFSASIKTSADGASETSGTSETTSTLSTPFAHVMANLFLFDFSGEPGSIFSGSMGIISVFSILKQIVSYGEIIRQKLAKKEKKGTEDKGADHKEVQVDVQSSANESNFTMPLGRKMSDTI